METLITDDPQAAAEVIRRGGLAAFPTETVYGLGAAIFYREAIEAVFAAKGRPADNPLIAHIADESEIGQLSAEVTPAAESLIKAFFPGPLTVVLKKRPEVHDIATAGLMTIGIRMPRNDVARRFLAAAGTPVAAPSANLSGRPSPTTWTAVNEDLGGRIDCILRGDPTEIGLESTVVDCTGERPVLLRRGAVTLDELLRVVPGVTASTGGELEARSPGMRHAHYAPRGLVTIGETPHLGGKAAFIGIGEPIGDFSATMICRDAEDYASKLFEFFRECDRSGIDEIVCRPVADEGIGSAVMDRLRRAAAK